LQRTASSGASNPMSTVRVRTAYTGRAHDVMLVTR
jgi:hypothetical protein